MKLESVQNLTKLLKLLENTYKDFTKPEEVLFFSVEENIIIFDKKYLDTSKLLSAIPSGYSFYTGFNYSFRMYESAPDAVVVHAVDMYVRRTDIDPLHIYLHFKYKDKDYMFVTNDYRDLSFSQCNSCTDIPIAIHTLTELCADLVYTILEHAKDKSSVSVQL